MCVDVVAHYIAKAMEGSVCACDGVGDVGQGIRWEERERLLVVVVVLRGDRKRV